MISVKPKCMQKLCFTPIIVNCRKKDIYGAQTLQQRRYLPSHKIYNI
jgi:hypothetical protein